MLLIWLICSYFSTTFSLVVLIKFVIIKKVYWTLAKFLWYLLWHDYAVSNEFSENLTGSRAFSLICNCSRKKGKKAQS